MHPVKSARLTVSILAIIGIAFFVSFGFFIKYSLNPLDFKYVPEYFFERPHQWHSESEEPKGYEKVQFAVCVFQRWCTYPNIQQRYFIIYRNNNKYSDQKFGTVQEVRQWTYVVETVSPDKQKRLVEIPKEWVFGKD